MEPYVYYVHIFHVPTIKCVLAIFVSNVVANNKESIR